MVNTSPHRHHNNSARRRQRRSEARQERRPDYRAIASQANWEAARASDKHPLASKPITTKWMVGMGQPRGVTRIMFVPQTKTGKHAKAYRKRGKVGRSKSSDR